MSKIVCDILGCDFAASFHDYRCVSCGLTFKESMRRRYYRLLLRTVVVGAFLGMLWMLK